MAAACIELFPALDCRTKSSVISAWTDYWNQKREFNFQRRARKTFAQISPLKLKKIADLNWPKRLFMFLDLEIQWFLISKDRDLQKRLTAKIGSDSKSGFRHCTEARVTLQKRDKTWTLVGFESIALFASRAAQIKGENRWRPPLIFKELSTVAQINNYFIITNFLSDNNAQIKAARNQLLNQLAYLIFRQGRVAKTMAVIHVTGADLALLAAFVRKTSEPPTSRPLMSLLRRALECAF